VAHKVANDGEDLRVRNDSRLHPKDAIGVAAHLHIASSNSSPETREEIRMETTLETFGQSSWSLHDLSVNSCLWDAGACNLGIKLKDTSSSWRSGMLFPCTKNCQGEMEGYPFDGKAESPIRRIEILIAPSCMESLLKVVAAAVVVVEAWS
jgi:hypothetical protein